MLLGVRHAPIIGRKQLIKMKPLDTPTFDGQAKSYARFKERFHELITSTYGAQAQLEFLEEALPERIKDRMSLVRKTPRQLWEQLDEMFGDSGVMVDEAIADLYSLDYKKLGAFLSERRLEDEEPVMIGSGSKSKDTSSEVCDYCSRPGHVWLNVASGKGSLILMEG